MKKAPSHPFALGARALFLAALFIACPGEATQSGEAPATPAPLAEELKPLQGHWEGDGAGGKCSITIEGNSLHYHNQGGWYKTTFTLPAGTNPQQLHATIKESSPPSKDAVGTVVYAIFKIEDGTLLLATYDGSGKPPETFDDLGGNTSRYTVRKVQPHKKPAGASTPK